MVDGRVGSTHVDHVVSLVFFFGGVRGLGKRAVGEGAEDEERKRSCFRMLMRPWPGKSPKKWHEFVYEKKDCSLNKPGIGSPMEFKHPKGLEWLG